jgi:hypothetical protein
MLPASARGRALADAVAMSVRIVSLQPPVRSVLRSDYGCHQPSRSVRTIRTTPTFGPPGV